MAKLGYTWYPKDWGNSESVFELNLSERGLYRELIDLAMLNDNKTEIKLEVWSRKFAIDVDGLKSILGKLSILNLIKIEGDNLFIPSCESRLNLVRGGSNGGKKSKPTVKPISKPFESLDEKIEKPIANQIEKEIESKTENKTENKTNISGVIDFESCFNICLFDENWKLEVERMYKIDKDKIQYALLEFKTHCGTIGENKSKTLGQFKKHFTNWVRIKKTISSKNRNKRQAMKQETIRVKILIEYSDVKLIDMIPILENSLAFIVV